jgi:hypothetical protein
VLPVDIHHSLRPALSARKPPFCRLFFACRLSRECSLWGRRLRPTDSCMCGGRRTARPRSTTISGPRAACAAALEERAGAHLHLTVRVHERARRAVRASCPCQLAITGRGFVLRAHPIEVAGRPRRRGRASSRPAPARSDRPSLRRGGPARWRPLFCLHDAGCCTHLVTRPLLGSQLARKISLVWRRGTGRRNEFQVFAKSSESAVKQSQPGNVIARCRLMAQTAR